MLNIDTYVEYSKAFEFIFHFHLNYNLFSIRVIAALWQSTYLLME